MGLSLAIEMGELHGGQGDLPTRAHQCSLALTLAPFRVRLAILLHPIVER